MIHIAINGFGRIGRLAFRLASTRDDMRVVAINDLADSETMAYLLAYDTAYGRFAHPVGSRPEGLVIDGVLIPCFQKKDPAELPWKQLQVDVVLECTGIFRDRVGAQKHLDAGAKKVIISAPAKGNDVESFVFGVNEQSYADQNIIDNASCTTNCAAPVMRVLSEHFGVEKALLSTTHSYTASQNLQDGYAKDIRESRAAAMNLIPTQTGSAVATARVIPSLTDKFDGMAVRIPTLTVSLTDITAVLSRDTSVEELNAALLQASQDPSYRNVLAVTDEPLVSSDFIGSSASATVDLSLTKVIGGNLVKVIAWYDNEWGYASRLIDMVSFIEKNRR